MSKNNTCYTYFAIKGDFDPDDISNELGLTPSKKWNIGDAKKDGKVYDFALWEYGRCDEYDINVSNQMRQTIKNLVPVSEKLKAIKSKYDAYMVLEIVPTIFVNESTPILAPTQDIIKFLFETGTELDIDLYVNK